MQSPTIPLSFAGVQIIAHNMTKAVRWRTERKWAHRKQHQPQRAFNYHSREVPDTLLVMKTPGTWYMHPVAIARLNAHIDQIRQATAGASFTRADIPAQRPARWAPCDSLPILQETSHMNAGFLAGVSLTRKSSACLINTRLSV